MGHPEPPFPFERKILDVRRREALYRSTMSDGDYVLGTQDDEVQRLGLQHRVWRGRVLEAFRTRADPRRARR